MALNAAGDHFCSLAGSGGWLSHRDDPLALPRIAITQPIAQSSGRLFDYLLGQL